MTITILIDRDLRPMWPWEHAVFAYLVYSLFSRAYYREPPGESETIVVVAASVLPDLIDKPLAWQFDVFRSGYAAGHSVFVAVLLAVAAGLVARQIGRPRTGAAFGVGYVLHLVGDVLPIYVASGEWEIRHLLWPVVVTDGVARGGLLAGVEDNLSPYIAEILALEPTPYRLFQLGIVAGAVALWIADGRPGWRPIYDRFCRSYTAAKRYARYRFGSRG